jgi:5-methylcytosine-specific restriction protein A
MSSESPWHHLYGRASWIRRRAHQLQLEPLCRMCQREGRLTPATVVDHVEPHEGDVNKFMLGKLQSLCARCHNSTKKLVETRGYDPAIGVDGMPLDPRHPVYRGRAPPTVALFGCRYRAGKVAHNRR